MGSRKKGTAAPPSGESELSGEESRHHERMELGIIINCVM